MDVELVPIKVWSDVISGKIEIEYHFLALKILMSRLRLRSHNDASPTIMQESVAELKRFFVKCNNIPKCKIDFDAICSHQ